MREPKDLELYLVRRIDYLESMTDAWGMVSSYTREEYEQDCNEMNVLKKFLEKYEVYCCESEE